MKSRLAGVALTAAASTAATAVWRWRSRVAERFEAGDTSRRPRDAQGIVIGAEEIRLEGTSGHAVLVLHGFNDTPQSMAYLSARLHDAGYSVHAPRLPGHGRGLRDMAREANADAWMEHVQQCYSALRQSHHHVYLCGQSMGGALAVLQAQAFPRTPALALLAPFLGMPDALQWQARLSTFMPAPYFRSTGGERSIHDAEARRAALGPGIVTSTMLRGLRRVALAAEQALPGLSVPTCYIQSVHDNRIAKERAEQSYAALGVRDKEQHWLTGSGHIISADYEKDRVAETVLRWFERHP
ncbi:MAG: alpha/beta fold hydrolase [Gemmatimonadaceae bacterium]|nr:alpha/beta fold hydrolase [Gemmatimonadaceae bacterium]